MSARPLPPIEFLRECFSYDPAVGKFCWRLRPSHHFGADEIARSWNSKFAGTPAFVHVERNGGYLKSEVVYLGKRYRLRASRVAYALMTGDEPPLVDHKNRRVTDNRFENLRAATAIDNSRNVSGKPGKVLPKGVFFDHNRFRASLSLKHRKLHLGSYDSPSEAHAAYCAAASKLFGEFFDPGPVKPTIWD